MKIISSVKGTRDFYPEQMRIRSWLYRTMGRVSTLFGYQEYDGPFLEYMDLYAAKSGEELVKEQAFVFQDRGGEWITLRPELTPTLARMVAQKQRQLTYPLRWWSFGPMWRYERPQKGRTREFFQWNIDLIGVDTPEGDAELVAIGATFLREVGLRPSEVQILVNNRRLVDAQLDTLSIPAAQRPAVLRLIDRREKMSAEKWRDYALETVGLEASQFDGLCAILENSGLWQESEELVRLFAALEALGVREYVRYAPEIVRGLDYYTGTVFEARDVHGEFRAILGGGRYDNLVAAVGGSPLAGVGFAMGDVVITLVLEKFGRIPDAQTLAPAPVLVTVFDAESQPDSMRLAAQLRAAGIPAALYPEAAKLGKQLKHAQRIGAPAAVIAGPEEIANGQVSVKDLQRREQHTVSLENLVETLQKILAQNKAS
ncbi:MAG: histidine--tRNA ligase [Anaerolineae bacterium]|nr:MAG: histidine--tRNA ligase [Anaerolineae bacterium]